MAVDWRRGVAAGFSAQPDLAGAPSFHFPGVFVLPARARLAARPLSRVLPRTAGDFPEPRDRPARAVWLVVLPAAAGREAISCARLGICGQLRLLRAVGRAVLLHGSAVSDAARGRLRRVRELDEPVASRLVARRVWRAVGGSGYGRHRVHSSGHAGRAIWLRALENHEQTARSVSRRSWLARPGRKCGTGLRLTIAGRTRPRRNPHRKLRRRRCAGSLWAGAWPAAGHDPDQFLLVPQFRSKRAANGRCGGIRPRRSPETLRNL